jgi:predicted RNA binding protein YcfA (HicA-like mRNA interferase family)
MGRLSGYSADQVIRVAERLGYAARRQRGSHVIMAHASGAEVVIPRHRVVADGTLHNLIKAMGLTVDEFIAMAKK